MTFFNREIIQEIKDRLDVLSVFGRYVTLQRVGSRYRAPCPFHQETKPSFYVDPNLGLYHCFGCHASGDIIDFYCKINGLEFKDGLLELAQEAGVSIKDVRSKTTTQSKRKIIYELNELSLSFFQDSLRKHNDAYKYLRDRNIDDKLIKHFKLGYALNSWSALKDFLLKRGFSIEAQVRAGLAVKGSKGVYDRFRNRIMFPILDITGRCIGFGGRAIGHDEPKYLNTSENEVFKKGENLYGLNEARSEIAKQKFAILTEGYIDVIRLHQYGYKNSCGVLGTALTPNHVRKIATMCPYVLLIFDGDEAGNKAAFRSAQLFLSYGVDVGVVELPEGEDVDTYLLRYGKTGLDKLIKNAKQGLVYCAHMIKLNNSPREVLNWCREFLSSLEDPALKGFYLPVIVKELGISEVDLTYPQDSKKIVRSNYIEPSAFGEKEILKFIICNPDYLEELKNMNIDKHLKNDFAKKLFEKLTMYHKQDILYNLDEKERKFYIEALFSKQDTVDAKLQWSKIKNFIENKEKKRLIKEAKEELIKAQMEKDQEKISFLINEINRLVKM